jgi:glycosyltransferase involved in cell wall biosynthesis
MNRVVFCRSNPISPDPRVEKEAAALHQAGYPLRVIAWDRSSKLPGHENKDGIEIVRLSIPAAYASGMRNLPALVRWQYGLTRWLWKERETYDIIHACDFDTILPALLIARLRDKKVVYDIFDFYADHLRATPESVKAIIRGVDIRAINMADAVILVDDSRRKQIAAAHPKQLTVIYNTPEDESCEKDTQTVKPSGSRLHLAYIGLLQHERGLFEMLDVLAQHPEWSLDLAGFGGDADLIMEKARQLSNVRWHGRVPYDQAIHLSQGADALFATYDPAIPNHRYSSPNKIFEAMMLGKPVIVAEGTNMDRIVRETKCGIVVPYADRQALETTLQYLEENDTERHNLGVNARAAYDKIYSWKIMRARLIDLYAGLGG